MPGTTFQREFGASTLSTARASTLITSGKTLAAADKGANDGYTGTFVLLLPIAATLGDNYTHTGFVTSGTVTIRRTGTGDQLVTAGQAFTISTFNGTLAVSVGNFGTPS